MQAHSALAATLRLADLAVCAARCPSGRPSYPGAGVIAEASCRAPPAKPRHKAPIPRPTLRRRDLPAAIVWPGGQGQQHWRSARFFAVWGVSPPEPCPLQLLLWSIFHHRSPQAGRKRARLRLTMVAGGLASRSCFGAVRLAGIAF